MELICPKCQGAMRNYERNGVHVDQCQDCRGIFLDRGELEHLVDAENSWHGRSPAAEHADQGRGRSGQGLGAVVGEALQQSRGQTHGSSYGQPYRSGQQKRKKKSFLDELFD